MHAKLIFLHFVYLIICKIFSLVYKCNLLPFLEKLSTHYCLYFQIDLSISRDGFVHFGDKVSICCPGALDKTRYFANIEPRSTCQLAVLPQINKILYSSKFEAPCSVTGSCDTSANLRSTFVIRRYVTKFFYT